MKEESIFINRELSWLDFNQRVLVLGKDKNVPLAEQLKFLAIYGSNLDEFFMVRVGSLQERANLKGKKEKPENKTNMTPEEQLNAIMPKTAELQMDCDKYYHKALEALAEHGYRKVNFDKITKEEERFWKKYFQNELFPILSPQIVDNRHPFPFLRNEEIYLGVLLKDKKEGGMSLGIIPISSQMERLCFFKRDGETLFALTEELVYHYVSMVFAKESIVEKCLFRVTRNADIDVKEGMMDHDIDYREIMTELLKRRRKLAAVRLQVTPGPAPEIVKMLCARLELSHRRVFEQKSPLDLSFFYKLDSRIEKDGHAELFYSPARPMMPPLNYSLTEEVQKHDVLLYYPYQSIRPFILMLKKAARDPDVISIKMTLYRLARESQIVQALVDAAENGKEVVALVELRARFDEQNNIDWSKQLEEADPHHPPERRGLFLYHPDRHRQLQRKDQRAVHRPFLHHRRPGHRRGGRGRIPEPGRPEADRGDRPDAGGPAALQERFAGRDGPGDRGRPSGPPRLHDPEKQLHQRPGHHPQAGGGQLRRRPHRHDRARHLLCARGGARQDREPAHPQHRGPLPRARPHLQLL